jgi:4-hydroxy-tetrahydrodipicolinate reductase
MARLLVIGDGAMGRAVAHLATGWDVTGPVGPGWSFDDRSLTTDGRRPDVAIEFTEPAAAVANLHACFAAGVPVVSGTTGWYDQLPAVRAACDAAGGAVLFAPNFSIGVQLFRRLVADAARLAAAAGAGFAAHLVETHHDRKKDAPSGTALQLAADARAAGGGVLPITSVRVGHVPGTHELVLDAPFETITLTHTARDRQVFAAGALLAARWLVGRRGVFTFDDAWSDLVGAAR